MSGKENTGFPGQTYNSLPMFYTVNRIFEAAESNLPEEFCIDMRLKLK